MAKNDKPFFVGVKGLIIRGGKMLLLQANKTNHAVPTPPYGDLPGGKIQHVMTEIDTLQREVREETGLHIDTNQEYVDTVMSRHDARLESGEFIGLMLRTYRVQPGEGGVVISNEHIVFDWFTPEEISELLTNKYPKEFCERITLLA